MELNQYLSMFIDESKDHLQALNENLLALEQQPNEISIVHNIFRSAHTLKGMSATMGYEDIASLTHQMENVLDLVRNLKLNMNAYIFDVLFKSLDALESMVNDIIEGGTGRLDVSPIVTMLKSIVSGDYEGKQQGAAAKTDSGKQSDVDEFQYSIMEQSIEAGLSVFYVEVTVRKDCVLKAARAYMVFNQFEQNGEVIKAIPSVEEIEQEKFDDMFAVYYISNVGKEQLEKLIGDVSEIDSVKVVAMTADNLRQIAKNGAQHGSPSAASPVQAQQQAEAAKPSGEKPAAPAQGGGGQANRTIRVDIERLDTLMNLFSELLIDRVRLEQLAGEIRRNDLIETVEHMARVSSDLQNIVLKLRMVPVETVFNRFPRMIRDIAKSLDKKVDLVITGAETELDRTVIDEIGDPLVHLLRNAIDHGVESVQDRLASGKNDTGTIQLRAFHSGNHVFIEIEDDGKGIHREKVLKTALKNSVITQEQAAKMTDQEVYQLLFASGFSTADKISDISGRGVGLDVVKTKIQSLGGHVHVDSKLGSGTKFSVQLPLTLSIIAAMLVRIGSEKYAIPLSSIVETMAVPADKVRVIHGSRLIDYRKSVVPIVSLSNVFKVPDTDENSKELHMVIVRKGDKVAALQVDDFIGQQEIVLKSLGKYLTNIFAVSGATILGDGQVALIIDPNALIK
ncbi:chemotaxis protein CheW [Paenibacillus sp. MBLB4367]|uniref:chemotaxis protein CheW n=1 Tax=Paenibacillus sp. MBLB4367 TaxID=3384767 RepID=UPI0039080E7D